MTTYTITPGGGGIAGGSAAVAFAWTKLVAQGGARAGGAALVAATVLLTAAGGAQVGGHAPVTFALQYAPAGGARVGGSAAIKANNPLHLVAGGGVAGGTAPSAKIAAGSVLTPANPFGQAFAGWALNYETNAPSRYVGLAANSMCQFAGKTFVANAGGIYEFGAPDDDDGAPIAASLTLPQSDFENAYDKRIRTLYLGLRASGRMVLRVVANGVRHHYYALTGRAASIRGTRATFGRDIKARYWQFRLDNQDGGDFDLDVLEFSPAVSSRHGV